MRKFRLDLIIDTSHKEAGTEARVELLREFTSDQEIGTVQMLLDVIERHAPKLIQWNWWEVGD